METVTYKKVDANDSDLMREIFRLRFEVYCHQCGFIMAEDYPDGLEQDEYDNQASHFVALNAHNEVIGTLRAIFPGDLPLPVEIHCPDLGINKNALPSEQVLEISRLVISKRLRRRKNDQFYYQSQVKDIYPRDAHNKQYLRQLRPTAFGLYKQVYQESKDRGITHWYSLMGKSLWVLLKIYGFTFEPIGDEVDVYGPVKPYLGSIDKMEMEAYKRFPNFNVNLAHS